MQQKIIILDFGSQTTQLIGRRVRELDTFCEILPYNKFPKDDPSVIGVILSGSPYSVHDPEAFKVDLSQFIGKIPVLGICYGAQYISYSNGGKVEQTGTREYGRANLESIDLSNRLFAGFEKGSQVWMSHGDTITAIPEDYDIIASTGDVKYAAFASKTQPVWAVQFHPEVYHSLQGKQLLENFVVNICGSKQEWSAASFVESAVQEIREQVGNDRVILGLSGGVDSSVCAVLLNKAIGKNLTCIFVDHGMLRKNEFTKVMEAYKGLGLNVIGVDASEQFFKDLEGVTDPEQKRKIIGRDFVEVFNAEAKKITDAKWLAQGTIYPDRIESLSITGMVIKSHHNVGGLPEEIFSFVSHFVGSLKTRFAVSVMNLECQNVLSSVIHSQVLVLLFVSWATSLVIKFVSFKMQMISILRRCTTILCQMVQVFTTTFGRLVPYCSLRFVQ